MTVMTRLSNVQEQLGQWCSAFYLNPAMTTREFITDFQYISSCIKYPDDWCIVAVIICVVVSVLVSAGLYCMYKLCMCTVCRRGKRALDMPLPPISKELQKFQKREKEELERKKKARMHHVKNQKRTATANADDLLNIYSEAGLHYTTDTALPEMGSRLEKYWYRVTSQESYSCHILTMGCISPKFTCDLTIEAYINQQLAQLNHPNLQTVNEVKFLTRKGKTQVAIIQPYWEMGSLKDFIHKAVPVQEWAQKYNKLGEGLPAKKVAQFGGQILEAVVYLYGRGYNPLGHIQTGNVYMADEDTCKLGGYENMMLHYRARLYKTCSVLNCLEDIDVVMFGHLIYEMAAGKELTRLIPAEADYLCVKDDGCKEILRYIFTRKEDGRFKRGIIKIQSHRFFGGSGPDETEEKRHQSAKSKKTLFKCKDRGQM